MTGNQNVLRAAYYLRISTETQELDNQRAEIMPFIERRGWKLVHPFEDVMSGRKTEKHRPGFATAPNTRVASRCVSRLNPLITSSVPGRAMEYSRIGDAG
jgi:hypothetical protein